MSFSINPMFVFFFSFRKEQMEEYVLTLDISKVYQESFKKIFSDVDSVKADQEYEAFIHENKRYYHEL